MPLPRHPGRRAGPRPAPRWAPLLAGVACVAAACEPEGGPPGPPGGGVPDEAGHQSAPRPDDAAVGDVPAAARAGPPNIVLVSVDGLRADRTRFGGNVERTTPNLDAVVAEGVRFPAAFSQSNESSFSHAALLTGRYASELALPDYRTFVLPEDALTAPEILRAVGYETAAFVAGGHVKEVFGFRQGWDHYFEGVDFGSFQQTTAAALAWLAGRRSGKPLFLFLHGYDCHRPYAKGSVFFHPFSPGPPINFDRMMATMSGTERVYNRVVYPEEEIAKFKHENGEQVIDPAMYRKLEQRPRSAGDERLRVLEQRHIDHGYDHYDSGVLAADTYVGLFLEGMRARVPWEDTVVVVTSDHGEDMQDHGFYNHRAVVLDSTTHVPFVLGGGAIPKGSRGTARADLVDAVDLLPTLTDIAGTVPPAGTRGRSVWPAVTGGEVAGKAAVFQQGVLGQVAIRTPTHRLVFQGPPLTDPRYLEHLIQAPPGGGAFQLYRTEVDPDEQEDLAARETEQVESLRAPLAKWLADLHRGSAERPMTPELLRMLQDHGYW